MKLFLSSLSLLVCSTVFSQIKVTTNGKVGVGTFIPQEQFQIGDRWTFHNGGQKTINYNTYFNGNVVRLQNDYCSSMNFNNDGSVSFNFAGFGNAGTIATMNQGFRIQNNGNVSIGNFLPSFNLDVLGQARAAGIVLVSDKRYKSDINKITDFERIFKLNGVSYKFNLEGATMPMNGRRCFGLIAQDVQKIFPEIVYSDSLGILGVDYLALIPYLVEVVKVQDLYIKEIKDALKDKAINISTATDVSDDVNKLFQNNPNPFNNNTIIKCIVSDKVKNATLYVYDMNGGQQKVLPIKERGTINVELNAGSLKPGLYFYTLICDASEVDTKKMIITE
ncbi:MAG: tail fiber domain-containing protein [Chitinophagales bacterium]